LLTSLQLKLEACQCFLIAIRTTENGDIASV